MKGVNFMNNDMNLYIHNDKTEAMLRKLNRKIIGLTALNVVGGAITLGFGFALGMVAYAAIERKKHLEEAGESVE